MSTSSHDDDEVWTTTQVAQQLGVTRATISSYHSRGQMPDPDGYLGSFPWWYPSTIETWRKARRRSPTRRDSPQAPRKTRQSRLMSTATADALDAAIDSIQRQLRPRVVTKAAVYEALIGAALDDIDRVVAALQDQHEAP